MSTPQPINSNARFVVRLKGDYSDTAKDYLRRLLPVLAAIEGMKAALRWTNALQRQNDISDNADRWVSFLMNSAFAAEACKKLRELRDKGLVTTAELPISVHHLWDEATADRPLQSVRVQRAFITRDQCFGHMDNDTCELLIGGPEVDLAELPFAEANSNTLLEIRSPWVFEAMRRRIVGKNSTFESVLPEALGFANNMLELCHEVASVLLTRSGLESVCERRQ